MSEHTPTPWKTRGLVIHSSDGIYLGAMHWDSVGLKTAHANMDFLMQAVNAHDKLVDFVQRITNAGLGDMTFFRSEANDLLEELKI